MLGFLIRTWFIGDFFDIISWIVPYDFLQISHVFTRIPKFQSSKRSKLTFEIPAIPTSFLFVKILDAKYKGGFKNSVMLENSRKKKKLQLEIS